jgi:hypothetical protein
MTTLILRKGPIFHANRRPARTTLRLDQARHTPRITTPSRHRATSTTATHPVPTKALARLPSCRPAARIPVGTDR